MAADTLDRRAEAAAYMHNTFVDEDTRLDRTADGSLMVFVRHNSAGDDARV
jgi:hypothetical protein